MDDDIGWNDFELRNYDPQIGRWVQHDPYEQFSSSYIALGNDPISNIDESGGWADIGIFADVSSLGRIAATTVGGAIIGGGADMLSGGDGSKGLLAGAFAGLASNFMGGLSGTILSGTTGVGKTASTINEQKRIHGPNIGSQTAVQQQQTGPGPAVCLTLNNDGFIINPNVKSNQLKKCERPGSKPVAAIILHRTQSPSAKSAINTFSAGKKGVHFLIDQDGTIYQLASLAKYTIHIYEGKQKKGYSCFIMITLLGLSMLEVMTR